MWIGALVPVSMIVCGNSLVGSPHLVAAAAAAEETGECEDYQDETAAYYAEDDVEWE